MHQGVAAARMQSMYCVDVPDRLASWMVDVTELVKKADSLLLRELSRSGAARWIPRWGLLQ